MKNILNKIGGKKMAALVGYILLMLFKDKLGVGPDDVEKISQTLMAYFIGQGVADGLSKGKTSHS